MLSSYVLYLGPYAEWRLRPKEIEKVFQQDPFWGQDPFWEGVAERLWMVGRVKYHRYCFCPHDIWQHPATGPLRDFRLNGQTGILDLREVDMQEELDSFTEEYGPLLDRVGKRFTRPMILHWGVVGLNND